MRKRRKKIGDLINKKLPKLNKKRRRKSIACYFAKGDKLPKPSQENEEENRILIEDKDKESDSSASKA